MLHGVIRFLQNSILLDNKTNCRLLLAVIQSYLDCTGYIKHVSQVTQRSNHHYFTIELKISVDELIVIRVQC